MTPISRRPIPRRCCIGRAKARKPSWRISATCCWTIDRGLSQTSARPTRRGPPNATRRCCCWRPAPPRAETVGADKGYDVARFVADVRVQDVTPHVAQKVRGSAIDGRTTRHAGYHVSQRKRKLVEQVFGWMKTVGGLRKLRHRGIALVDWQLTFAATAYNLSPVAESGGEVSLIAGRRCRWPPRRLTACPRAHRCRGGVTRMMAMKTGRSSCSSATC